MKTISRWIFHGLGWKTEGEIPKDIKKYVLVAAPHTSNWDFFYGRIYFYMHGIPLKFLIKKELFFFPLGIILKALGGIPVNRKKNENLSKKLAEDFKNSEQMALLVTPEGTRSYNPRWKKGFYYIAQEAKVPIILGYIDYEKKIGGIGPVFEPTGDVNKDIETIKAFYKDKKGKYPEKGVR
jgi:1-acyl-sn-glycerol-3-phosphate acyltransferase